MTRFKVGDKVKYAYGGRNNVFVVVKVNGGKAYVAPEGIGMGADDGVPAKDSELSPLPRSAHNAVLNEKVCIGDYIRTSNPVVANAMAWRARNANRRAVRVVVTNAAGGNVKVTMQTVTFPSGKKPETRTMTLDKFDELLRSLGASGYSQRIMLALSTYGKAQFTLSDVDVDISMA